MNHSTKWSIMLKLSKIFLLLSVFVIACSFSSNSKVKQGNVIYFFESGKMQCLSEINSEGQIFVLLKSLKKNTQVEFSKLELSKENLLVVVLAMIVKEETEICKNWTNMQEVKIAIDPKQVKTITLSGKKIYQADNMTIMTADE